MGHIKVFQCTNARYAPECTGILYSDTVQYAHMLYCNYSVHTIHRRSLRTGTTTKMLMRKLKSWCLQKSFACQKCHYNLYVNIKTPYHLIYNPLLIQSLSKFQRLVGGGEGDSWWGVAPSPASYDPANCYL